MPIGNGELGANVWVEEGGDLLLLLSRTDAWSEANRLLKLGRLRLHFEPNPFQAGQPFRQRLHLRAGRIEIDAGSAGAETALRVFVDTEQPVAYVTATGSAAFTVTATLECWRTAERRLQGEELKSSWTMRDAPDVVEVREAADRFLDDPNAVVWCHRNETSLVPFTLRHQGLEELIAQTPDPLLRRTFGGRLSGPGWRRTGPQTLAHGPGKAFFLQIATHGAQTESVEAWRAQLAAVAEASALPAAAERSAAWWQEFWARSWIFVGGHPAAADLNRAYALSRWMFACAGRGAYPIKFNGSIFTVEPKHTGGPDFDPDWRRWGGDYWWQNTRLPYHAMLASGDFDLMAPLFRMYGDALALSRARARLYYGADGAYFPETMTHFGSYSNGDYGWAREGIERGKVQCPWWEYAWNQGPELVALMLDYYDYTGDVVFRDERLLPMADAVLRYFASRFVHEGKLHLSPTQALETHWHGVVNDAPCVAGLHAVLPRLLALEPRAEWRALHAALPPMPTREVDGVRLLAPAERYDSSRQNCETPELYALWPFRLYGLGRPGLELARASYERRHDRFTHGWPQDGQQAALLGLVEEARANLLAKAGNSNSGHRFPAMWGPNFDWCPDQCHAANLMLTLQTMLLQCSGGAVQVLPAWPKDWDVSFQLRAPQGKVVRAEFRDGELKSWGQF